MTEARSKRRVLPFIFIGKNCLQGTIYLVSFAAVIGVVTTLVTAAKETTIYHTVLRSFWMCLLFCL